jgi:hypothetical protein
MNLPENENNANEIKNRVFGLNLWEEKKGKEI